MSAIEVVLLDAGDTLLRERSSRWAIYARSAAACGVRISPERMRELMGHAHRTLSREHDGAFRYSDPWFRAFIAEIFGSGLGLDPAAVAAVTEELFAVFEDAQTFRLFPGAFALLDALHERGITVGIVSNWSARLPRVLAAVGLAERLDFVVCSALVRAEKPEPEIFRIALERAGAAADRALHAGDHLLKDIEGARAAGIAAVLVDHDRRLAGGAPGDVPVVHGLPELASYILDGRP